MLSPNYYHPASCGKWTETPLTYTNLSASVRVKLDQVKSIVANAKPLTKPSSNVFVRVEQDLLPDGKPNTAWRRLLIDIRYCKNLDELLRVWLGNQHNLSVWRPVHDVVLLTKASLLTYPAALLAPDTFTTHVSFAARQQTATMSSGIGHDESFNQQPNESVVLRPGLPGSMSQVPSNFQRLLDSLAGVASRSESIRQLDAATLARLLYSAARLGCAMPSQLSAALFGELMRDASKKLLSLDLHMLADVVFAASVFAPASQSVLLSCMAASASVAMPGQSADRNVDRQQPPVFTSSLSEWAAVANLHHGGIKQSTHTYVPTSPRRGKGTVGGDSHASNSQVLQGGVGGTEQKQAITFKSYVSQHLSNPVDNVLLPQTKHRKFTRTILDYARNDGTNLSAQDPHQSSAAYAGLGMGSKVAQALWFEIDRAAVAILSEKLQQTQQTSSAMGFKSGSSNDVDEIGGIKFSTAHAARLVAALQYAQCMGSRVSSLSQELLTCQNTAAPLHVSALEDHPAAASVLTTTSWSAVDGQGLSMHDTCPHVDLNNLRAPSPPSPFEGDTQMRQMVSRTAAEPSVDSVTHAVTSSSSWLAGGRHGDAHIHDHANDVTSSAPTAIADRLVATATGLQHSDLSVAEGFVKELCRFLWMLPEAAISDIARVIWALPALVQDAQMKSSTRHTFDCGISDQLETAASVQSARDDARMMRGPTGPDPETRLLEACVVLLGYLQHAKFRWTTELVISMSTSLLSLLSTTATTTATTISNNSPIQAAASYNKTSGIKAAASKSRKSQDMADVASPLLATASSTDSKLSVSTSAAGVDGAATPESIEAKVHSSCLAALAYCIMQLSRRLDLLDTSPTQRQQLLNMLYAASQWVHDGRLGTVPTKGEGQQYKRAAGGRTSTSTARPQGRAAAVHAVRGAVWQALPLVVDESLHSQPLQEMSTPELVSLVSCAAALHRLDRKTQVTSDRTSSRNRRQKLPEIDDDEEGDATLDLSWLPDAHAVIMSRLSLSCRSDQRLTAQQVAQVMEAWRKLGRDKYASALLLIMTGAA